MTIFSMLFGAGLILMSERAAAKGQKSIFRIYFRRLFFLMLIGMAHGMLLWFGDILYAYAVIGMMTYWMRRFSVKTLIIVGVLLMLVALPLSSVGGYWQGYFMEQKDKAMAAQEAGETLTAEQEQWLEAWEKNKAFMEITPETLQKEVDAYLGSYSGIIKHRAPFCCHDVDRDDFVFWDLENRWVDALRYGFHESRRVLRQTFPSFLHEAHALGLRHRNPLRAASMYFLSSHQWNEHYFQLAGIHWNYIGSALVGLGHIGLVIGICKKVGESNLLLRFSAVGRMAFTNYLMQSVLCTFLFYGYGLGLYGTMDRVTQMGGRVGRMGLTTLVEPSLAEVLSLRTRGVHLANPQLWETSTLKEVIDPLSSGLLSDSIV